VAKTMRSTLIDRKQSKKDYNAFNKIIRNVLQISLPIWNTKLMKILLNRYRL